MARIGARARLAVAVLFVLQAFCAASASSAISDGAQSAMTGMSRDIVCAAPRWDDNTTQVELISQNLTVTLFPQFHCISVAGSLRFKLNYDVGELQLWLYKTLNITRLESGGIGLNYARNSTSDKISLSFSPKLPKGQFLDIDCAYEGEMWVLEGELRQDCVGWEGAYVKGSTHWYIMHHSSDWANYSLTLSCPPNWTAVADGELVSEEHSAQWANYTWVSDRPCMRPAFAAFNYTVASRSSGGVNITTYTYPEHSMLAAGYINEAARVMTAYTQILGSYGRKSFKIVETNHTTMTGYACSGFVMLYPGAFAGASVNYNLLSHETAHQWFPFLTGYIGWAYPWLWEAFSEYLSCIYENSIFGSWTRLDRDRDAFVAIHDDPRQLSIRSTGWDDPLSYETLYAKGAWVLHMLRNLLGDADFYSTLNNYVSWNRYQMGSVDSFIAIAKGHTTLPLDPFFQQWLNTTFDLDMSFSAARIYDNGTGFFLELEPVNLQCATGPADIQIQYADDTTQTLRLAWNGAESLVRMPVFAAVSRVRLDPGGWLLEIDRTNNEVAPFKSGNVYDMQARSLRVPYPLIDEQQATITAQVRNNSSYGAKAVRLDFHVDGKALANMSLDMPQGAFVNSSFQWQAVEGRHTISVTVDSDQKFHEWDEANNNASIAVDVAPRPPRLDICVRNLTMDKPEPFLGDYVNFTAEVCNLGEGKLGMFFVEFALDRYSKMLVVPGLEPGTSTLLSVGWNASTLWHNVSFAADPQGSINETDEDNNRANGSFFVRWHLELFLDFSPKHPAPNELVNFDFQGDNYAELLLDYGDGVNTGWMKPWGLIQESSHSYAIAGSYTVRLMTRYLGMEEETSLVLNVTARPIRMVVFAVDSNPMTLDEVRFGTYTENLTGMVLMERWDFGDDPSRLPVYDNIHVYARAGTYHVSCTITTAGGATASAGMNITVQDRPPVIRWDGPAELTKGANALFAANGSDPDGNITLFSWYFGDGTCATGVTAVHSFQRTGKFNVRLIVVDDSGSGASYEQWVAVREPPAPHSTIPPWLPWLAAAAVAVPACGYVLWRWNRRRAREYEDFFSGRK